MTAKQHAAWSDAMIRLIKLGERDRTVRLRFEKVVSRMEAALRRRGLLPRPAKKPAKEISHAH